VVQTLRRQSVRKRADNVILSGLVSTSQGAFKLINKQSVFFLKKS
jgi:hypothetical protein